MAKIPIHKLRKKDLEWLATHLCKAHSTSYLQHYGCFLREKPLDAPFREKLGFFDIESSSLQATFGIMYCYCILDDESGKILERTITPRELKTCLDKKVVEQCIKDIKKFDRITGYYSSRFDLPFVRTRALYHGLEFPEYKELLHTDLYFTIRNKFKLHSNRQESAYNMLVGESHKTHWGRDHWVRAMTGDKKALNYIIEHCRIDVKELRELYYAVEKFSMKRKTSI